MGDTLNHSPPSHKMKLLPILLSLSPLLLAAPAPQIIGAAPGIPVLVLAGLGPGAGVAVGSVGAAIGLASARQEVGLLFRLFNQGASGGLTLADAIVGDDVLTNI